MLSSLFYGLSGQLRRMPSLCQARSRCASGSCVVTRVPVLSLLVSNTTPGEYFQLFLFAGFAPTEDFCKRPITTQANIVLIETAIANTGCLQAADRFAGRVCHRGFLCA